MSPTTLRHAAPPYGEINSKQYDDVAYFFRDEYFQEKLVQVLYKAVNEKKEPSSDAGYSEKFIREHFLESINKLARFMSHECVAILAQLKIEARAVNLMILFDDIPSPNIIHQKGHSFVTIPSTWIFLALTSSSPQTEMARIAGALAHEIYHFYSAAHFPEATAKSVEANEDPNSEEYQKDRGEIAAALFSLQHLEEQANFTRSSDAELSAALTTLAEQKRKELSERTQHLSPLEVADKAE